ncbi:MAG: hypothetical protein KAY32_06365 [Candidatus Eisenbacteria sp.]|nr:hypothetical protein [Candidatus Eisenbacteria bacterium]
MRLNRTDQAMVREALAYASRRMFDPHDTQRVGDLEDLVDVLLLGPETRESGVLTVDGEHLRVFRVALIAYCEALDHPSTDSTNRVRIARLRRMVQWLDSRSRWPARLGAWLHWLLGGRS